MNTAHSYEELSLLDFHRHAPVLLESFAGTEIVKWHGRIESQLKGLLADAEKGRNFTYADKVREFLTVWREHEITGSINRETLDALGTAARILSVDSWNLSSFFHSLSTQLKVLIASEEQLPRGMDMNQNEPMAGGGGAGRGAPPMSPSFGPEEEPPPGMEGGAGGAGGPGASGPGAGGPGAGGIPDGTIPPGEAEPGAEGSPEDGTPAEPGTEGGAAGEQAGPMGPTGGPELETPETEDELDKL